MNQASNASGTTRTTLLEDIISENSFLSNDVASRTATPSICSRASTSSSIICENLHNSQNEQIGQAVLQVYNYKLRDFDHITPSMNCEEVCLYFCRKLCILPTTKLLFGLRIYDNEKEWVPPNQTLRSGERYCFRMRFKVASLDTQLQALDPQAYEYLYNQMRFDMVRENIPEIRYPAKKDNVMGLGMVDMCIDHLEKGDSVEIIESNYKKYLPSQLLKAHKIFAKSKICNSFKQFLPKNYDLGLLKRTYVDEINKLAPNYLLETFNSFVNYIPDDPNSLGNSSTSRQRRIPVVIKIDLDDNFSLKISRNTSEKKWFLLAKLEDFYTICTEGSQWVDLEIAGLPKAYRMQFEKTYEMESFITYLSGYFRLTTNWKLDLCKHYASPSLIELNELRCHGPIGGNFSFSKLREKRDQCGSYIIRQCEKEYDVYYIDINTKPKPSPREKCKTETFKIKRDHGKWVLHNNETLSYFDQLTDLAQSIYTESDQKFRIPPSDYDKAPLLLICLPKKFQRKMTDEEVNEKELLRQRVQVLHPKIDLQWYKNSQKKCDNGKIIKMRADWIQQHQFKEIAVTLKVLKSDDDFSDFMKLADMWSNIYSPQFIKLHGITLSTPYTMVMEYAKFGPLNEFLAHSKDKVSLSSLLDVVHGLVRGIVDMQNFGIIHCYIRCANLYVTKFDSSSNILEAKIGDPGIQRPYGEEDLPWIPLQYYNDIQNAKNDPSTDHWAFATTLWEIFSQGACLTNLKPQVLRQAYNTSGAILKKPDRCPGEIYKTMMDGWSLEPDKRFNMQEIFSRLSFVMEGIRNNYENPNEYSGSISNKDENSDTNSVEDFPQIIYNPTPNRSYFDDIPSVIQIPNGKLIYNKKIGEGHYGTVYLGEIQRNSPNSLKFNEKVAIKTLKSLKCKTFNDDFERERKIMESLNHPNIVKIKLWVENPLSIIMEYVESGSFLVYLNSRKPILTNEKLLKFALDIAEGMDYLRNKKIIHRDLAARNILVDADCVKISDFGLAQVADADGYYLAQSIRDIPIKWYSPESIKTGKFSFQHDVWSYGVTLFEMFSRGEDPNLDAHKNLTKEEFLNRLEKGERLRKPISCPDSVYDKLMMPCWRENPKSRPNFKDLKKEIESMQNESGESI